MEKLKSSQYNSFLKNAMTREVKINGERCRPVFEFNSYFVSITGRIYRISPISKEEIEDHKKGLRLYFFEHQYKDRNVSRVKHYRVKLKNDVGIFRYRLPAFLVALSFGIIPVNYIKSVHELYYLDGDKKNININNLAFRFIENNSRKLTPDDVVKIKKLIELNQPLRGIAELYGVSSNLIRQIKVGLRWNTKKSTYKPKKSPIQTKDRSINKILAGFDSSKLGDKTIKHPFTLRRGKKGGKVTVLGFVGDYKFKRFYTEVTIARAIIHRLNNHFFDEKISNKIDNKFDINMYKPVIETYKIKQYEQNRN